MRIGSDFDGVIANTHMLKVWLAKEKMGIDVLPAEFRREKVVGRGLMTLEQYRTIGQGAMGGLYPIPEVEQATFYLHALAGHGYSIKLVTSRTGQMLEVAEMWLWEHCLNFPIAGTGYGLPKNKECEGLDVYVDDDLEKLIPLIGTVKHLLFFSWPWNLYEIEPKEITRVGSWWEIYNYIRYET